MKDAPVGCNAKEGEKFSQAMDKPSLATWCWKGSNGVSSHKPQRCMDETALQRHGKDYKHNFTLLLQVNKHRSGRSPAALQSTTQPAACRLLQATAVLSPQITTEDRPLRKQDFQMNHSLLVFPRKTIPTVRPPSHTKSIFRTGAPSETQPQRQRA